MARALNTIITEGKFKGELSIVPRMWDVVLKGLSYDVIANKLHSFVTLLDVGETPTDGLYGACLWEDDNGFVHSLWLSTENQYKDAILRVERGAED